MSPIFNFLVHLSAIAKQKQTGPVACCWCNNQTNFIKYGKYRRYLFSGSETEEIQRYLCKHDKCRRTFSILPHPFLRITRFSLCMFNELINLFIRQLSTAEVARQFAISWARAKRLYQKGQTIMKWINQEALTEPVWRPSPCLSHTTQWSNFIRMFAIKFYPRRYANLPPTDQQKMNIYKIK
jgi:transposase-like protein